ncbi:hypothetical protein Y032_0136g1970 [Ancylostoma ceylanicum]|uniref:Uncharacterized protein n=1 Tax=Ancylostoma ceylanicum TaxID=53326 RepID=A0A016T4E8_9BILA|nr:hypothetical protein Y032_0136g1970 [Ancylostoma ceylanicum]
MKIIGEVSIDSWDCYITSLSRYEERWRSTRESSLLNNARLPPPRNSEFVWNRAAQNLAWKVEKKNAKGCEALGPSFLPVLPYKPQISLRNSVFC